MKDLDMTMEKAAAAVLAGNKEEAAFLFRVHERMKSLQDPSANQQLSRATISNPKPDKAKSASHTTVDLTSENIIENGFTFREGASTKTDSNIGLTPFFEKNINELRLPVPLTIFNEEWQEEAWQYHAEKKVRSDDSTKAQNIYSGLPYPHEFSQTYMTWTINYRNFIKAIRHKFKFAKLAEWLEMHKENVENIRETECWMVAFRYDLKMRMLLFTEKVTYEDGATGPIDISKYRIDIKETCFAKARKCDELSFNDNPYAYGGERFESDHNNGTPRNRQSLSRNSSYNSNLSYSNISSQNTNQTSNMMKGNTYVNQSSGNPKPQFDGKKRKGYMGSNFDANYVRKGKGSDQPAQGPSKT